MTIAEQIYTLVRTLPQDQASTILMFAEFVSAKHLNANQTTSPTFLNNSQSASFKAGLDRLHALTENLPSTDPVALIQEGREELSDRGGF
ncbi:DUF2281 domain-containing protein [Phormidesmis sp. 146-33]